MAAADDVEHTHATILTGQAIDPRLDAVDCLIVLAGEDPGRRIYLEGEVMLGRGKDCTALISDVGISRQHARVTRDEHGQIVVDDLGSRNGTRVNGDRIHERTVLKIGDEIAMGDRTVLALARRERFEDKLLVAQKMQALGQLAGGIAHDFNNILGALFANVTFLGAKEHDEETEQCLEEMEAAVRRAIDLTRQLSGFGRKTTSERRSIRVHDLVHEGVGLLRRTLPRNVTIDVEIPPRLFVVGDASRLLQVVMNLCINAKDAMPRGGTLTIGARAVGEPENTNEGHRGSHVELTFADTGLGIDSQTLDKIFEPFFTTKPRGQGTGLGLATVQAILRDHGGSIEVYSEVGKGTDFAIRLPSAEDARHATLVGQRLDSRWTEKLEGLVLVADDDELVRAAITRVLTREGAEVAAAANGAEALRRYAERAGELRLIILDIDMPRVDGPEVLRVLRSFECDLPVVIVSGHVDSRRMQDVRSLGINEILPKPFAAQNLLDAVRRHMRRG
ncbi:MAG: response regulator [Myxococcota bacterium]